MTKLPIVLRLLIASFALTLGGCDRFETRRVEPEAITAAQLASHFGVSRFDVEVPAGLGRPQVVLQATERGGRTRGTSRISLGDNREPVLLLRFDADEGGRASLFGPGGGATSMGIDGPFQGRSSTLTLTRSESTVSSGDWLILCGTAESSAETEKDPEWTYRLYVLEEGQSPEDAGW